MRLCTTVYESGDADAASDYESNQYVGLLIKNL